MERHKTQQRNRRRKEPSEDFHTEIGDRLQCSLQQRRNPEKTTHGPLRITRKPRALEGPEDHS